MSEAENFTMNDLMKKLIIISKNVKALSEIVKTIDEKIDVKAVEREPKNSNEEKEKMDKIFQAKSIGRPSGSFEEKRKKYCDMLNKGQIKQPKNQTLEYYKLIKNEEDKSVYLEN